MRVEVCRPCDLGEAEVEAWRRYQKATPGLANPFLAPGFARAAGATHPGVRVAVALDGGAPCGFLAFQASVGGVASPVAAGSCDAQAFVHAPGLEWDGASLLAAAGLRGYRFDHLVGSQAAAFATPGGRVAPEHSWEIDLSGGWDGYLEWGRSQRARYVKWLERKDRRLQREGEVEFVFDSDRPEHLRRLLAMKSAQCRRLGWRDVFSSGRVPALVEALASGPDRLGVVSVLCLDGQVVAADFSLRAADTYAGWLIAYDDARSQLSPGAVRWWRLLQAAAAAGVTRVDLGRGTDDFKRRYSTGTPPLAVGWACGRGSLSRVGGELGGIGADLLGATGAPERARRVVRDLRRRRYDRRPAPVTAG